MFLPLNLPRNLLYTTTVIRKYKYSVSVPDLSMYVPEFYHSLLMMHSLINEEVASW